MSAQTYFETAIGGTLGDHASFIEPTKDGGYVISGETTSFGNNGDVIITKIDANGNHSWTRTYGGSSNDHSWYVSEASNSDLLIANNSSSVATNPSDAVVIRTDSAGKVLWERAYDGGFGADYVFAVRESRDGNIVLAGMTTNSNFDNDCFIAKLDANGNNLWSTRVGGTGLDLARSFVETHDSGFVMAGLTYSYGVGAPTASNIFLAKVDKNGVFQWGNAYDGLSGSEWSNRIIMSSDSNLVVVGSTTSFGLASDVLLFKTDTLGNVLWTQMWGGANPDMGYSVQETYDRGFILSGHGESMVFNGSAGNSKSILIKTDMGGNTMWANSYGGAMSEESWDVVQHTDSGYITAGVATSFGAGIDDVYSFRTDRFGLGPCSQQIALPNHVQPSLVVTSAGSGLSGPTLSIVSFGDSSATPTLSGNCTILGEDDFVLEGERNEGNVVLRWKSESTNGVERFNVERSLDGENFLPLGNAGPEASEYRDLDAPTGELYYRLRRMMVTGESVLSEVLRLAPSGENGGSLQVHPHPLNQHSALSLRSEAEYNAELTLFDAQGRVVQRETLLIQSGTNQHDLSLDHLPAGIYILSLRGLNHPILERIRLVKH